MGVKHYLAFLAVRRGKVCLRCRESRHRSPRALAEASLDSCRAHVIAGRRGRKQGSFLRRAWRGSVGRSCQPLGLAVAETFHVESPAVYRAAVRRRT